MIPFCSRCQEMSAAALRETRSVVGEISRLDGSNGVERAAVGEKSVEEQAPTT